MNKSPSQRRGTRYNIQPRDLQVSWANLRKSQPSHITMLQLAFEQKIDVLCVQEPWTQTPTRTQNHPGYDCYAPIDSWEQSNEDEYYSIRPRVLTYIRKGARLRVQQRRPTPSRDMLWIDVNERAILNVYREPHTPEIIDYVTHLLPPRNCLIGGDFNAWHSMFEPGVTDTNRGGELAAWSSTSGMDYIGNPGEATHDAGHVLDLSFSNIPFAKTSVRPDIYCVSDHVI
jgi:hypothetical protein